MSRRRPSTPGMYRRVRGIGQPVAAAERYRPLAAIDVTCYSCEQRVIRLSCDERPDGLEQCCPSDYRREPDLLEDDEGVLRALRVVCACRAAPLVSLDFVPERLRALVDEGRAVDRVSVEDMTVQP